MTIFYFDITSNIIEWPLRRKVITITRFACEYNIKLLKLNGEKHNQIHRNKTKQEKKKEKQSTEGQKERNRERKKEKL